MVLGAIEFRGKWGRGAISLGLGHYSGMFSCGLPKKMTGNSFSLFLLFYLSP
jgi:hypothetical protein